MPCSWFDTGRPMNVSALKSMREHWPVMMQLLARVRAAYLRRCPEAAAGFTVGQLERLATAVLALPSYLLMRTDIQLPEGAMHPALSSLFRVTDGLRMTLHQMLFVPIGEPTLLPDAKNIFAWVPFWWGFAIIAVGDDLTQYWYHRLHHQLRLADRLDDHRLLPRLR